MFLANAVFEKNCNEINLGKVPGAVTSAIVIEDLI